MNPTNPISRQRALGALVIYGIVVFVGGPLLAPCLYWLAQSLGPNSSLAHNPFHRFVDRSLLALALIGIWPLLRNLGARSWRDLGLVHPRGQWKLFLAGFALGFGSLAFLAGLELTESGRQINSNLALKDFVKGLGSAAGTAIVVAVLEEILFRGGIFGGLRRFWDWRAALLVSSMIYAIVHFLQKADLPGPIVWSSGLKLLPEMLRGFADWNAVIPAFFNLTLVGILLGLAYQRTGNLYCSIGMHAGWIFWLRAYGMLTVASPRSVNPFWGSQKLIDGWLALCVLALTLAVFQFLPVRKTRVATV